MTLRDIDYNGFTPDDDATEAGPYPDADRDTVAREAIAEHLLTLTEVLDRLGRDALGRLDAILEKLDPSTCDSGTCPRCECTCGARP